MDKKKENATDVDDLIRRTLMVVYWLWHGGKAGQDTLEAACRIKEHQGNHEAEVSCGGEADLHRHLTRCKKNPGHTQFIPIQDFKIEHLPDGYREKVIFDWFRVHADMTCRVSVRYTSENRPKFFPGRQPLSCYPFYQDRGFDFLRTGTGWVSGVRKYTEEDNRICECEECTSQNSHSQTPKKVWGKVDVVTACHVVFDSDEARHTTCEFFYDTSSTHVSQCPTINGLKVETSFIEEDLCHMTYVSHDSDLINKLYELFEQRYDLGEEMHDKYGSHVNQAARVYGESCRINPTPEPVVIISHPHGCSKMVTVGMWTHRQMWGKMRRCKNNGGWEVLTVYSYNTATCPGSSGAPVIRLPVKGEWLHQWNHHTHSQGGKGNNNKSAFWPERVSPPTRPEDT